MMEGARPSLGKKQIERGRMGSGSSKQLQSSCLRTLVSIWPSTHNPNTYTHSYRPAGASHQIITAVPICSRLRWRNTNEEGAARPVWWRELLFISQLKVQIPVKVGEVV